MQDLEVHVTCIVMMSKGYDQISETSSKAGCLNETDRREMTATMLKLLPGAGVGL